jgi:hypothetical protein
MNKTIVTAFFGLFSCLLLPISGLAQVREYDVKFFADYMSRGYFVSNSTANMVDENSRGVDGPFEPSWNTDEADRPFQFMTLKYIYQLNRGLKRLPVFPGSVIYRGIYSTSGTRPETRYPKGRVWLERRFQSSTSDLAVAESFAIGAYKNEGCGGCARNSVVRPDPRNSTVIHITHRSGRDISRASNVLEEKEVLLGTGLIFKVTDAARDRKGRYIVKITELDPANLSAADAEALRQSESKRTQQLIQEYYGGDARRLQRAVEFWNKQHRIWATEGIFEKDDFDWQAWEESQGGG